ncbi:MAG: hypothetical protein WAM30_14455, partial [Candidatus Dormiibacterota bacterium]
MPSPRPLRLPAGSVLALPSPAFREAPAQVALECFAVLDDLRQFGDRSCPRCLLGCFPEPLLCR